MRIRIDIPDDQAAELRRLAEHEQKPVEDLVREAIQQLLDFHRDPIQAAFGIWPQREDGLTYERRLRDEWGD
ncbi:MAG TPA: ribbon-helix-helix protein, CopG family [Caulobacteraceae bacterium]|nr:ribbon-helix-helix protein, CopG family [Caulobacteraceae bacterium]